MIIVADASGIVVNVNEGNGWTQLILPVAAILISVCAAALAFLQWTLEGRRVSVDANSAVMVAPPEEGGSRSALMLSVTNYGRIPAVIRQWGFDNPREIYGAGPGGGGWSRGPDLPHTLEPGATQVWWLDYGEQKKRLSLEHPGGPYLLRGYVVLGTKRRKYARSLINLGNGITVSPNPIRRWVDKHWRPGIGCLISGKIGSDHFNLTLTRTGMLAAFAKVRVDAIQAPRPGQPARVLPNSLHAFRFIARKNVSLVIPNDLLGIPDVQYRVRWYTGHPNEVRYGVPAAEDLAKLRDGSAISSGNSAGQVSEAGSVLPQATQKVPGNTDPSTSPENSE